MLEFALLINGAFKEIRRYAEKPADIPHKNVAWYEVVRESGATAFTGIENGKWVIRSVLPTLAELKAVKLNAVADKRWQQEISGTTFNGMPIATDATSQTKYIGAVVGAQIDPTAVINWKLANGDFVPLDAQTIVAVAMAVRAHVQACFDREAQLRAQIEAAATVEELDAINIYDGWPA